MTTIVLYRQKQISPRHPTFSRSQLRCIALQCGLKTGRNTGDTLRILATAQIDLNQFEVNRNNFVQLKKSPGV